MDTRYDRLIRTYGMDAFSKIKNSTIYIMGMLPTNKFNIYYEICKNLALSGVKNINLIGNHLFVLKDYINELNNIVNVNCSDKLIINEIGCIVIINTSYDEATEINNIARTNNCSTVYYTGNNLLERIVLMPITIQQIIYQMKLRR